MIKEKFISAIIGILFFIFFQPFGILYFGMAERVCITCGLLAVAFISCLTSEYVVRFLFNMPFDIDRDTSYLMKRGLVFQICNVVVLTIFLSLFFACFVNNEYVDNHLSLENLLRVFLASIGCCFFIGLYWRNVYWKRFYAKQLQEAQFLNGVLMERAKQMSMSSQYLHRAESSTEPDSSITLEGNTKESVTLRLSDFLFAEAKGNYVLIQYLENGELEQTMLRTSMKNIISLLCISNEIMQCHRAYIINLRHVENVEGRSSGIGLKLYHCDAIIPVSKNYMHEVKERIKNPF